MRRPTDRLLPRATVALAATLALSACRTAGGPDRGPAKVEELVTWVERMHVETELTRQRTDEVVEALRDLVAPDSSVDPAQAYATYLEAIERVDEQTTRLRDTYEPMQKASGPVFAQWQKDLDQFHSDSLRNRSEERLAATKGRFEAIVAAAGPALQQADELLKSFRDHALFLGHDFNAASLAAIEQDLVAVTDLAGQVDRGLAESMAASQDYVENAAPPLRAMPAGPDTGGR